MFFASTTPQLCGFSRCARAATATPTENSLAKTAQAGTQTDYRTSQHPPPTIFTSTSGSARGAAAGPADASPSPPATSTPPPPPPPPVPAGAERRWRRQSSPAPRRRPRGSPRRRATPRRPQLCGDPLAHPLWHGRPRQPQLLHERVGERGPFGLRPLLPKRDHPRQEEGLLPAEHVLHLAARVEEVVGGPAVGLRREEHREQPRRASEMMWPRLSPAMVSRGRPAGRALERRLECERLLMRLAKPVEMKTSTPQVPTTWRAISPSPPPVCVAAATRPVCSIRRNRPTSRGRSSTSSSHSSHHSHHPLARPPPVAVSGQSCARGRAFEAERHATISASKPETAQHRAHHATHAASSRHKA